MKTSSRMALTGALAAMALAGPALGMGLVPRGPKVPPPPVSYIGKRPSLRQRKREERRERHQERRAAKLRAKTGRGVSDEARAVNGMTNWQRNQWARAGYPKGLSEIRHFAALARSVKRDGEK